MTWLDALSFRKNSRWALLLLVAVVPLICVVGRT